MNRSGWRSEFVEANGIRFHVVTAGEGPLVILLHGFPQCWYGWRRQIPALSARFRVAAPDLRGYGKTGKPPRIEDYRLGTLAQDVVELIRALGAERAAVIGHDWGGGIAWHTALHHPEAVERLAVLNCPHPRIFARALRSNPRQMLRSWYIFFFQIPRLPEWMLTRRGGAALERMFRRSAMRPDVFGAEDLRVYREAFLEPGAAAAAINYYRAAFRDAGALRRAAAEERRIAAPTLLIWGEEDSFLGRELTLGMEPLFAGPFRLHRIPGCSHWVNEEQPELVNRLLLEFLEEENGSAGESEEGRRE